MFRTAVRRFATTAVRSAETVAPMEIARAQRISHNGLVDGMRLRPVLLCGGGSLRIELTDL